MTDIKAQFLAELDNLDNKKRQISIDQEALNIRENALYEAKKELETKKTELEKILKDAGGIDEITKLREELSRTLEGAKKDLNEAKVKRSELISWENRLVDIEARQKNDREENLKKQIELDEEKRTYKVKLKQEFLETVKNQLSQ